MVEATPHSAPQRNIVSSDRTVRAESPGISAKQHSDKNVRHRRPAWTVQAGGLASCSPSNIVFNSQHRATTIDSYCADDWLRNRRLEVEQKWPAPAPAVCPMCEFCMCLSVRVIRRVARARDRRWSVSQWSDQKMVQHPLMQQSVLRVRSEQERIEERDTVIADGSTPLPQWVPLLCYWCLSCRCSRSNCYWSSPAGSGVLLAPVPSGLIFLHCRWCHCCPSPGRARMKNNVAWRLFSSAIAIIATNAAIAAAAYILIPGTAIALRSSTPAAAGPAAGTLGSDTFMCMLACSCRCIGSYVTYLDRSFRSGFVSCTSAMVNGLRWSSSMRAARQLALAGETVPLQRFRDSSFMLAEAQASGLLLMRWC